MFSVFGDRRIAALSVLTVSLALVACGKDSDDSKDSSRNCSYATVSAYNDVFHQARMYDISRNSSYLYSIRSACSRYKSFVGAGACNAKDMRTGAVKTVTAASVDSVCEPANRINNP